MTIQKLTLSINAEIYKDFKEIKHLKGLSISSWINSLMAQEVKEYRQNMIEQLASGIGIAKAMYETGMRLSIIKEKLILIYGEDKTNEIIKSISE